MQGRRVRVVGTAALAAVALASLGASAPAAAAPMSQVVVQASSVAAASLAVERAGGRVLRPLPIVDGVSALVPQGRALRGVLAVTPDDVLRPASTGDSGAPSSTYPATVQATSLPAPSRQVTVAIIDTGIAAVPQLAGKVLSVPDPADPSKTAPCANFSSEKGDCGDSYGHGTFLAGLIAGGGAYPGVDPAAKLVSIKIAGRNGSADTSALLAALQYVVSFKDTLGIKVLNLSLGTDSTHDYRRDPLNRAVERAWRAGIVVVVSGSNRGPSTHTISKPADDPLVVTVGAIDEHGTSARSDDTVPSFSGRGPVEEGTGDDRVTVYKPDVVAPGVGLISLTSPGSHIEQTAPASTVGVSGYRRGSGTSQSAAVTSGAVALLLERRAWTPDEVKAALYVGAHRLGLPFATAGAGGVDVQESLRARVEGFRQADPRQDPIDGLDATRAGVLVSSFACGSVRQQLDNEGCDVVAGPLTALGKAEGVFAQPHLLPFDANAYVGSMWNGQSWYSSQWVQGQSWYGQSWYGQSWYGQSWYEQGSAPPPSGGPVEGTVTPYGVVLPGSAWYGVWQ